MPPRREPTWSTSLLLRWLIYLPLMVGLVLVALGVLDALSLADLLVPEPRVRQLLGVIEISPSP